MNQTLSDLQNDLEDLAELADSCGGRTWSFKSALGEHPFVNAEFESLWSEMRDLAKRLRDEARAIETAGCDSGAAGCLPAGRQAGDPAYYANVKREGAELLRILHGKLGYLLAAPDWQSPTFLHSLRHQAGKQVGRIVGTENDYKRDMHLDAFAYEHAFLSEYVDAPLRLPPAAYVTVSGMAAMSTLVGLLQYEYKMRGPIVCGRGSYFENRWILERAFRDKVHLVDEMNADEILETVRRVRPEAVFLDTLCNTAEVAMPNLAALLPKLARALGPRGILVLDNSGLASSFQPFAHMPRLGGPRLFVIESLNKFHQFGFDRVTGGIIWTQGGSPTGLLGAREHLGTNMPDASVLSLPWPNRALMDKRLARIGRNAQFLAERLDAFAATHPGSPLLRAVYPGLPSHPAYAWTKEHRFKGGFLALAFKPPHARANFYKSLIARIISEAARRNVQLVAGSSFGLDGTRLYLTALHATRITTPFFRVSAGTETEEGMETIAEIFKSTLERA